MIFRPKKNENCFDRHQSHSWKERNKERKKGGNRPTNLHPTQQFSKKRFGCKF